MSVSWFEAWRLWFSGKPLSGLELWGLSFIWWGRIGKILEFVAAYGVIVEIAGPTRLRRYGESLRHLIPRTAISAAFRSSGWLVAFFLLSWFAKPGMEKAAERRVDSNPGLAEFTTVAALILAIATMILGAFSDKASLTDAWTYVTIVIGVLLLWLAYGSIVLPLLIFAFMGIVSILGIFIDLIFFRGMAAVLEYENLDKAVKIGSLVVLAIGFQFDLLTT